MRVQANAIRSPLCSTPLTFILLGQTASATFCLSLGKNTYWFELAKRECRVGVAGVSVDFTMDLWHSWGRQIVALVICVAILQTSASKNFSNFPGSFGYPHRFGQHTLSHAQQHTQTHCKISFELHRRRLTTTMMMMMIISCPLNCKQLCGGN